MTKKEALRQTEQAHTLMTLGFSFDEAEQLRRISMTLHRWYELECGDSNEWGSWAIERDDDGDGKPFMVHHHYAHGNGKDSVTRTQIADRERGAVDRLKALIKAVNVQRAGKVGPLSYYLQTDPRGASLYILRPGDIPEGKDPSAYYNRGICVY